MGATVEALGVQVAVSRKQNSSMKRFLAVRSVFEPPMILKWDGSRVYKRKLASVKTNDKMGRTNARASQVCTVTASAPRASGVAGRNLAFFVMSHLVR